MASSQLQYTGDEIAALGDEIYARDIQRQVENDQNKGKFVLIDIKTGDWEMDADEMAASGRMRARHAEAQVWMVRVGYTYSYRLGGGRRAPKEAEALGAIRGAPLRSGQAILCGFCQPSKSIGCQY